MSQLSGLHSSARKLTLELRQGVERLERMEGTQQAQALGRDMRTKLGDLQRISGEIERTWRVLVMQEGASKREIWKHKVEQVIEETDSLRLAIDRVHKRENRRQADERDRAELMMRIDGDEVAKHIASERGYDPESHERESAAASHHMLDHLLATGAGVLSNLGVQRDRLKSVHRKMRDVLQTTGLSERLLRVAQRRQGNDKLLVYGGMLFILCFLWLLWRWAR